MVLFLLASFVLGIFIRMTGFICWAMARQMELDADRCQTAAVGPRAVGTTLEKISAASLAMEDTLLDAQHTDMPCPDNLARWVARKVGELRPDQRKDIARMLMKDAVGVVHPSFESRVAHAKRLGTAGQVKWDSVPGTALLQGFDALAQKATLDLAQTHLPRDVQVVPVDQMPRG